MFFFHSQDIPCSKASGRGECFKQNSTPFMQIVKSDVHDTAWVEHVNCGTCYSHAEILQTGLLGLQSVKHPLLRSSADPSVSGAFSGNEAQKKSSIILRNNSSNTEFFTNCLKIIFIARFAQSTQIVVITHIVLHYLIKVFHNGLNSHEIQRRSPPSPRNHLQLY